MTAGQQQQTARCRRNAGMAFCRILGILAAWAPTLLLSDDLPPGVRDTQNPADQSLTPQQSLSRMTVPDGFQVTLFAGEPDVRRPIAFDFDDRGRLWVVENYSHPQWRSDNQSDRVVILEDSDGDGMFDQRKVFWDKGRYLTGIAYGFGGIWLADTPDLIFIPDRDGNDVADGDPQVRLTGFQKSTNNVVNNLHWGPDGWLYGAIGLAAESRVSVPDRPGPEFETPITRGLWRYHPVDGVFEKIAEGMVNPWGADFNQYGDLFTANTVLAHLWHIVPGMYCERRASESDNPYAYQRIQSIANHLHWGGGVWNSSRSPSGRRTTSRTHAGDAGAEEYARHSVAGGGHAHCGAMIYLGDNWPQSYFGSFFTINLHGNRVNRDRLLPNRSTWVGTHAADFLLANDDWFRGLTIRYGPDGGVFISDWHDFGECHDSDGSHRSSGRIYKVMYGRSQTRQPDLQRMTSAELVALHSHANEWYVRRARRILHERSVATPNDRESLRTALSPLRTRLFNDAAETEDVTRLRAMWTLYVCGQLSEADCLKLLATRSEHVRRWAVFLLTDKQPSDMSSRFRQRNRLRRDDLSAAFTELLQNEDSPRVRLAVAAALQRLHEELRLSLAAHLVDRQDDENDPYLPLMIWYGIEPAVVKNPQKSIQLALDCQLRLVRRFVARRLADADPAHAGVVLRAIVQGADRDVSEDLLQGLVESFEAGDRPEPPPEWPLAWKRLRSARRASLQAVALRLATIYGDPDAIAQVKARILDQNEAPEVRQSALRSLVSVAGAVSEEELVRMAIQDAVLRSEALQGLAQRGAATAADKLLNAMPEFSDEEKRLAISILVMRRDSALQLLNAIQSNQVDKRYVSAYALQQLRSFPDQEIRTRVHAVWGDDSTAVRKAANLQRLLRKMTPDVISEGDPSSGRLVFQTHCAKCHSLFGEGGRVGPDLTGSGRRRADYVLRNLIDPSAEIDEAYRLVNIVTKDGRLLSGFIVRQDDRSLTIRTQEADVRLPMKDIDELVTSDRSMMPDGLPDTLSDEQIRDLLEYLQQESQVPLAAPTAP